MGFIFYHFKKSSIPFCHLSALTGDLVTRRTLWIFLHLKYNDSKNKLALPGKTVRIMYQIQDASILDRAFGIMKQKDSRVYCE